MKIKKQYDLLKKIKHSKEGISATEYFLRASKNVFFISLANTIYFIEGIYMRNIKTISVYIVGLAGLIGLSKFFSIKDKEPNIKDAEIDLQKLVNELSKLEVKTSVELLQEAKINQVVYKIKYEDDDKIPRLAQYKYIDIPLVSGYEETLLQEHKYGDKDYELSVNSPVKKMKFKLAKQGI